MQPHNKIKYKHSYQSAAILRVKLGNQKIPNVQYFNKKTE